MSCFKGRVYFMGLLCVALITACTPVIQPETSSPQPETMEPPAETPSPQPETPNPPTETDTPAEDGVSGTLPVAPQPEATAPWLIFDYTSLNRYRSGPPSLSVAQMPENLQGMLDACLYRDAPYGHGATGGWYLNTQKETETNAAAQAFFTAMAEYVNEAGGTDDFLKVKMIHDWVVEYLDYDDDLYDRGCPWGECPECSQSATNILRRGVGFTNARAGMATCGGYAALFRAFMEKLMPLDNQITRWWVIEGWGGDPDGQRCKGNPNAVSTDGVPTNHAWNQVEIAGNVYSVDCTWDDPTCGSGGGTVYAYLFPSPFVMIRDHISKYFDSQLLDEDNQAPWDDTIVTWEEYTAAYRR